MGRASTPGVLLPLAERLWTALLIPTYMCQRSLGGRVLGRYGRAVLLNVKACLLIAVVLMAAACYEATEVIMMMKG